jgi:predicted phosphodiesterase
MKKWKIIAAVALLFTFAGPLRSAIVMEPYLQAITMNSVYILVECDTQDTVKVAYGSSPLMTDTVVTFIISATTASPATYVHKIRISGLAAGSIYYYQVSQDMTTSGQYSFRTLIGGSVPYRMAWAADFRTGTAYHAQIAALIDSYDPLFTLYGGDYCNSSAYSDFKNEWFLPNQLNLDSHIPSFPAIGNHETWGTNSKAFFRMPDSPSGTQDYYSFDAGDVHFLCLNNQVSYSAGSAQYLFAQSDLAASTKPWKIVFCHNPAYCNGGHGEDANMVAMSQNLFVPNHVDMVIAGHSHLYQRNYVDGIYHMVIGDAGAPPVTPGYDSYTILSAQDYEFAIIDVTTSSLALKVYTNLNVLLDSIRLNKPPITSGPISGVRSVGPEPSDFPTLCLAMEYLRTEGNGIKGPLVLELKPGYSCTGETFPLVINAIDGISSTNTLTIRPTADASGTVLSSSKSATLMLNNCNNIIIDGRPGGTGTSLLTIENTSTSGNAIVFINDASHNTIRHCTIKGVNSATSTGTAPGVIFFTTTTETTGNDDNLIERCRITNGASLPAYLFYSKGTAGKENSGNVISRNEFSNFRYSAIYHSSTGNGNNWLIASNSFFYNYPSASSSSQVVIRLGSTNATGNLVTGNNIGGQTLLCGGAAWPVGGSLSFTGIWVASAKITMNKICNIGGTSSSGTPTIYGIYNAGASGLTNEISTNMVSLSGAPATDPVIYCIYDNSASGTGANVYYNACLVWGPNTTSSSTYVYFRNGATTLTLTDNIFSNQRSAGGSGYHFAIFLVSTGNLSSGHNDLFSTAGPLGYYSEAAQVNLAEWRSATGCDANSLSVEPVFTSVSDLHIQWDASLNNTGTPVPTLTLDYDGNTRGDPPDPGINEFSLTRKWSGSISTDWNDPTNWSPLGVPLPVQDILLPSGAPRYPELTSGMITISDLTLESGASILLLPDITLNISGNLLIGSGALFLNRGMVILMGDLVK